MPFKCKSGHKNRLKMIDSHDDFLRRITKSLYYGKLPTIPCLSFPVMELSADVFSETHKGHPFKRLYLEDAAELTRNACVSPCALVLALVYLDRLKSCNPEYVANMAPTELFLVSLMISSKFLQDTGEEDEVFPDEWAASAGITSEALNQIERDFLHAIDWRVFVSESQFGSSLEWLEHQISLRQGKIRGWFTYTDLTNINNNTENIGLIKCLATVYAALSISYLASVYTIVASSLIVSQSLIVLSASNGLLNNFLENSLCLDSTNATASITFELDEFKSNNIIDTLDSFTYSNSLLDNETTYFNNSDYAPISFTFLHDILLFSMFNKQVYSTNKNFNMDNTESGQINNLIFNNDNCKDGFYSLTHRIFFNPLISC